MGRRTAAGESPMLRHSRDWTEKAKKSDCDECDEVRRNDFGGGGDEGLTQKFRFSIREVAEQLVRSNYPNLGGRPMFLPVDWRNELHLDDGMVVWPWDLESWVIGLVWF